MTISVARPTVKTRLINEWNNWALFEKIWLATAIAVILTLSIIWNDTTIGFISSIAGIICVVLAAKGKIATYYFGVVQAGTYAYISYTYALYGEAMLNAFFFLPLQFIGWIVWFKFRKTATASIQGENVYVKRLTWKQWAWLLPAIAIACFVYAELLSVINAQQVRLDSVAVILSVAAQILMMLRYADQWILWIIVNILTITLWFITLVTSEDGNDWAIFAMWCAFLVNSVYGWLNWRKIAKAQNSKESAETVILHGNTTISLLVNKEQDSEGK